MTGSSGTPSTTLDPLSYLEQNAGALGDAVARKNLADKLDEFSSRWERNKDILANLEAVAEHASAFSGIESSGIEGAKSALAEIAEFARDMKSVATRDRIKMLIEEFGELKAPADRLANELRKAYADLIKRDFEPLGAAGHVLAEIDATSNLGERLKNIAAKARNLAGKPTAEFMRGVSVIRTEADSLRTEYKTVSSFPGAQSFLDALIQGEATLAHVNADVLTWLDTLPGARERFRITSG